LPSARLARSNEFVVAVNSSCVARRRKKGRRKSKAGQDGRAHLRHDPVWGIQRDLDQRLHRGDVVEQRVTLAEVRSPPVRAAGRPAMEFRAVNSLGWPGSWARSGVSPATVVATARISSRRAIQLLALAGFRSRLVSKNASPATANSVTQSSTVRRATASRPGTVGRPPAAAKRRTIERSGQGDRTRGRQAIA
jgi:hypothetical protein